jgi:SAM-dependent methyltransferase
VAPRDYSRVSEVPGIRVTPEAVSMVETRYAVAADWSRQRDVLEVGCGAGMGLGALADTARRVVGGDCAEELLTVARRHYGRRVPLLRLDAQCLPFRDGVFDVVVLYEAIYYLERAHDFLAESRRVLRSGGTLLVCSANPELETFNPSPLSTRYWSARELAALLECAGFEVKLHGAFADTPDGRAATLIRLAKLTAVRLGLMPRTMRGKEFLKRLFFGRLTALPAQLTVRPADLSRLKPLVNADAGRHKVVYAIGQASSLPL